MEKSDQRKNNNLYFFKCILLVFGRYNNIYYVVRVFEVMLLTPNAVGIIDITHGWSRVSNTIVNSLIAEIEPHHRIRYLAIGA